MQSVWTCLRSLGGVMPLNQAFAVRKVKVRGEQATVETVIPTQTPTTLRLRKVERSVLRGLAPGPRMESRLPRDGPRERFIDLRRAGSCFFTRTPVRSDLFLARVALAPQERL